MPSRTSHAVCLVLLLAAPGTARAQELAGSFDQLRVLVKAGDTVRVTDKTGQEVRGAIVDLSSSSLSLRVAGTQRTFLERDIAAIHQRRNDSLANGAKWGFAVGAGLGVLAGAVVASEYKDGGGVFIPLLALTYGGMGAGVGAGIDAMNPSEQVIFAWRGKASW
jgi:hypothetical protein